MLFFILNSDNEDQRSIMYIICDAVILGNFFNVLLFGRCLKSSKSNTIT